MNNNGNHHGNKFLEGFVWGLIIGGAVVFVMGTKKGKKLLKTITEEGVGNLADIIDEGMDEDELDEEELEESIPNGSADVKEKINKDVKPTNRKRFFRRKSS